METIAHTFLSKWESYYVIVGSSAAALTGLQFVVMALIAESPEIRSTESVAAFGTPTVVHFCLCLSIAAVLSAPWETIRSVTWLLVIAGIVGVVYTAIVIRRARRQTTYQPVGEDWLWHAILPLGAHATLLGSALFLPRDPATMLFPIGGVALLLVFIGIHNAWDSVAFVATKPKGNP